MVVAIDGPCGSGKGTIAKLLSEKLNLVNIDTGATYRCLALKTLENNIELKDEQKIIQLSENLNVEFKDGKVFLDGQDVSKKIREKEVTQIVSPISSIVEVRKNMVELQRKMASTYDVILEGRDITTVVFPNAEYKFYLDATLEERVNRRIKQNKELNIDMSEEEIRKNISDRDYNDMHKPVGALKRTEEQIYIDSTNMTIDEVVEKMISIIEK
jgi:cytidylate kinase